MNNVIKLLVVFALGVLLFLQGAHAMTRQQLKNSGKLMKKTCMPKNDVTEEQVGEIEQGKFLEDRNVQCYIACVYGMMNVVSKPVLAELRQKEKFVQRMFYRSVVWCFRILDADNSVKNGKLSSEAAYKTIDLMFPPELKEPSKVASEHCKEHAKKKDLCEAAYYFCKCMYDFDPRSFIFP